MVRIAVVIPTYRPHIESLRGLLADIEKQTRIPDIVSVAASSVTPAEIADLSGYSFRFLLESTSEKRNAAENRNVAAAVAIAAGADVVSFFDSDDTMHPGRTEYLAKAFEKNPDTDVILHSYDYNTTFTQWGHLPSDIQILHDIAFFKHEPMYSPFEDRGIDFYRVCFEGEGGEEIRGHYGHVSVRASTFEKVWQTPSALGYEDAKYAADLLKENYAFGNIPYALSCYNLRA